MIPQLLRTVELSMSIPSGRDVGLGRRKYLGHYANLYAITTRFKVGVEFGSKWSVGVGIGIGIGIIPAKGECG